MKKLFILLLLLACHTLHASTDSTCRLSLQASVGYRTFALTDVNNSYTAEGFSVHKYTSTLLYTLGAEYRAPRFPRFSLLARYSFAPAATRYNSFFIKDTTQLTPTGNHYDSVRFTFHTVAQLQTATLLALYSLPLRRFTVSGGAGISFSMFRMYGTQDFATYHWADGGPVSLIQSQHLYTDYNREYGFGFIAQAGCRYRLSSRWQAFADVALHICSFAIRDGQGDKIQTSPGIIGTSAIGINYDRYLGVQLTGFQASLGISYDLF